MAFFYQEMDTNVLIGWQEERVRLRRDVSRLQDELAESNAEREELTSRSHALDHRVTHFPTTDTHITTLVHTLPPWYTHCHPGTHINTMIHTLFTLVHTLTP